MIVETEELRQEMLQLAGELLEFPSFSVYGYPGFSNTKMYDGETSLYHINATEYLFKVTSKDVETNGISSGDTFTYTDGVYLYSFKLNSAPIPDLTGFSTLNVTFKGKTSV